MTTPILTPHPAHDCRCGEHVEITLAQMIGAYEGIYDPDDFDPEPAPPVRTETACNAYRCSCIEYAEGPLIDGWRSCHVCGHTNHSHKAAAPNIQRKARR